MGQVVRIYPFCENGRIFMTESNLPSTQSEEYAKNRLREIYADGCHSQLMNLLRDGREYWHGVVYDYRPFLQKILVKQYGQWSEYYAPSKNALRRVLTGEIQGMVYYKTFNDVKLEK